MEYWKNITGENWDLIDPRNFLKVAKLLVADKDLEEILKMADTLRICKLAFGNMEYYNEVVFYTEKWIVLKSDIDFDICEVNYYKKIFPDLKDIDIYKIEGDIKSSYSITEDPFESLNIDYVKGNTYIYHPLFKKIRIWNIKWDSFIIDGSMSLESLVLGDVEVEKFYLADLKVLKNLKIKKLKAKCVQLKNFRDLENVEIENIDINCVRLELACLENQDAIEKLNNIFKWIDIVCE